ALYRANFLRRLFLPKERIAIAPVQLVIAENDAYVSTGIFDDMARWVPQLFVKRVRGGHWLPLKQPQKVAKLIADFVRALEGKEEGNDGDKLDSQRCNTALREFTGKQVLVTGAASGIGRATALAFAEQGANLILADLNLEGAERTALLARLHGVSAWACRVDVGDGTAMRTFADGVEAAFGIPDIVVNNAGIGMAGGLLRTSEQDWERILRVNLWGIIHGTRFFGERMVRDGGGHIVNVASAAAFTPSRTFPAYATTKAAALMLSECARAEFAALGVGVSTVCPGFVDTGIALATQYAGVSGEEQQRRRERAATLYRRRGFTPDKVAQAIVQAVRRNRALTLVGAEAVGARWLSRYLPWVARVFARIDFSPS
ncbi:MAG TPA: SDR family oxidoreductase, partial [Dongiaceae bacterium]|nr:SDR family oxidoreductase [Dongiaceae bacterium]